MSVLVRIGKQKAILRDGVWVCADRRLEQLLNSTTDTWIRETGGPPVGDRDHEGTVAAEISRRFGGHMLLRVKPSARQAVRVYISRRQLGLFP